MILQLLGTLLLTAFNGAMSVESQRSSAPIKENSYQAVSTLYVNGGYVLKNVDNVGEVYFDHVYNFDDDIYFDYSSNNYGFNVYCPDFNDDSNRNYSMKPVSYFRLHYLPSYNFIDVEYNFEDDGNDYGFSIGLGADFTDISYTNVVLSYMAIYFDYPCYLTQEQLDLFSLVFTGTLNSHYVRYKGWYSFYKPVRLHYQSFDIYSSMLVNNSNYNYLEWVCGPQETSDRVISVYNTYVSEQGYEVVPTDIYRFGYLWYSNIYFSNLFANDLIYQELVYSGQFVFSPDNTQYGLDDLFLNIADTPVIFITSLFSFELFGVEFYLAFMGIITAIAMIFIIRKIL